MSVTHEIRVPAPTSVPKHISCAALTGNPQWEWRMPCGLPVVPEVYRTSSGSSEDVGSEAPSPGWVTRSSHDMLPAAPPPIRLTTITYSTDGQFFTAAATTLCAGVR